MGYSKIIHKKSILGRLNEMKKICIYVFILILICFALPIIFTSEFQKATNTSSINVQNVAEVQENIVEITYNY